MSWPKRQDGRWGLTNWETVMRKQTASLPGSICIISFMLFIRKLYVWSWSCGCGLLREIKQFFSWVGSEPKVQKSRKYDVYYGADLQRTRTLTRGRAWHRSIYTVCNEDLCAQTGTPNWAIVPPTHSHSDTGKSMAMDFLQAEQPLTP